MAPAMAFNGRAMSGTATSQSRAAPASRPAAATASSKLMTRSRRAAASTMLRDIPARSFPVWRLISAMRARRSGWTSLTWGTAVLALSDWMLVSMLRCDASAKRSVNCLRRRRSGRAQVVGHGERLGDEPVVPGIQFSLDDGFVDAETDVEVGDDLLGHVLDEVGVHRAHPSHAAMALPNDGGDDGEEDEPGPAVFLPAGDW